jgi:curli biogenesis system outer membrane secretion channel CsgG
MFETALVNSNHFIVIDRENLIKIIEEHKLKQAGITSSALSDIVQQSGVEYIITGAVTEFGIKKTGTSYGAGVVDTRSLAGGGAKIKKEKGTARIVIDIKITETKTGNIVYKGAASGEAFSDNVNLGLGILTGSDIAAGVTVGSGVIGFDETIAGQAARVAAYELVNKIMKDIQL